MICESSSDGTESPLDWEGSCSVKSLRPPELGLQMRTWSCSEDSHEDLCLASRGRPAGRRAFA